MDQGATSLDAAQLQELVAGTAAATGEDFFAQLVRHLARALETHGAWVTEWLPATRRLRALAFWAGEGYVRDFEYDVSGTPCEPVVEERRLVHVPERLLELFPGDPDIRDMGAASYLGVPLLDTDGGLLGHLAVLDTRPRAEEPRAWAMFEIFAGRAAAELRRIRRERDLAEREEQLSRLVESAMDAIVELDAQLQVRRANRAAGELFGCPAEQLQGSPFARWLDAESQGRLAYLERELARRPEGQQAMWVPAGLQGLRADGCSFPAEATLSRFRARGQAFTAVILRDVDAREAAAARIAELQAETAHLRSELEALQGFEEIVGESPALRRALADVERVAPAETTVLITGETGTGKELVARAIHGRSARADGPLVTVNCAAIPAGLQESEFFGHEKGAFTGATQRRQGRLEQAHRGTIFLDEVGELPLDLQAKLLRVLQEGEVQPVGSGRTVKVDVRVIAATHRDLEGMVEEGRFRRDLLYRLNVFPLHLPPLRERGEDVLLLARAFATRLAQRRGGAAPALPPGGSERLLRYDWPGNIRELHNVIERAWITSTDGRTLNLERALSGAPAAAAAPATAAPGEEGPILTAAQLRELEKQNLLRALRVSGGKLSGKGGAGELLGLNPNTLASRMKSLGVERPRA